MSIEIIYPKGDTETRSSITFDEIKRVVGGYVEVVSVIDHDGELLHGCCNEDGRRMMQPHNPRATIRLRGKIIGDCVGPWVLLKGKDLLK